MGEQPFICPVCGRESTKKCREEGNVVLYECSLCGSLISAYLKNYNNILKSFFDRYKLDKFKPHPPIGIGGRKSE
jgi:transcription elongation factor Elf1